MIISIAIAIGTLKSLFQTQQEPPSPQPDATTTTTTTTTTSSTAKNVKDEEAVPYVSVSECHSCDNPCQDQDHPHYPSYLKIDQELPLLHSMKPYTRHVLISTGQDDWESSIDDDKDSLAPHLQAAINRGQDQLREANGGKDVPRIVLTNSSRKPEQWGGPGWQVIILPDQIVVNNVTPDQCDDFFEAFLKPAVYTAGQSQDLTLTFEKDQGRSDSLHQKESNTVHATQTLEDTPITTTINTSATTFSSTTTHSPSSISNGHARPHTHIHGPDETRSVHAGQTTFIAHRWLPKAAIMICSHKKRDKRCGITAPILFKEFKRILRFKDLFGDCEGDVEIWNVSHIGGHKFAGNVIVHKSEGMAVWYGRVNPCHCQAIVDTTIEQGQVIRELYRGSMIGSFNNQKKMAW